MGLVGFYVLCVKLALIITSITLTTYVSNVNHFIIKFVNNTLKKSNYTLSADWTPISYYEIEDGANQFAVKFYLLPFQM